MKTLYQAQATAQGGRNGKVSSSDGVLALDLALPRELGGQGGARTNPEQLFAAGYAACFDSALAFVAAKRKLALSGTQVNATVGIGPNDSGGFQLAVKLRVTVPGVERATAQELVDAAHVVCPYSNALRGNVAVELELA